MGFWTPHPLIKHIMQPLLFSDERTTWFETYHRDNPQIYTMFKQFAFEAINAGVTRLSSKAIVERLRWQTMIRGNDEFKINNNVTPYYARLFNQEYPQHEGFFATRNAKADEV